MEFICDYHGTPNQESISILGKTSIRNRKSSVFWLSFKKLFIFFKFYTVLKVTFHLWLLQNIGLFPMLYKISLTLLVLGFHGVSDNKESACRVGDLGSIPGLGRSLKKGMAHHSSILAWRSYGQRSLAGYSLWGCNMSLTLSYTQQFVPPTSHW